MFTGQAPHAFAFRTHHQRQRPGKFALIKMVIRLAGGADDPHIMLLQQTQRTRQIGDADQRHGLRGTAGDLFGGGVQRRRAIARYYYRMDTGGVGAAQAGAKVMRIGNTIQNQQQRRGLLCQ